MRKKREKRILRGTVFCGVLVALFVFCALPALAGENGTLLWWGNVDVNEPLKEDVLEYAAEARVSVILGNQPGETEETLKDFLVRSNPATWEYPVTLYWAPDHGWGWTNVGGYTPTEIVAMVEEAKNAIGGKKLDTVLLGPCYSGNIETMSCFSGLTKKVFGTPATATIGMVRHWLQWIDFSGSRGDNAGYESYVQREVLRFRESGTGGTYGSLVDPEEALAFLQALREKDLPASVFQDLRKGQFYYGTELNDIWKLAEDHGLGDNLLSFTTLWNAPYGPQWENHDECCYLGVWNGENEDLYIATVPEANRCIPGSSVTPDEPTPVPEGMASGGGGCMVGANNFPALLLLIPLTVVMVKRGKK